MRHSSAAMSEHRNEGKINEPICKNLLNSLKSNSKRWYTELNLLTLANLSWIAKENGQNLKEDITLQLLYLCKVLKIIRPHWTKHRPLSWKLLKMPQRKRRQRGQFPPNNNFWNKFNYTMEYYKVCKNSLRKVYRKQERTDEMMSDPAGWKNELTKFDLIHWFWKVMS